MKNKNVLKILESHIDKIVLSVYVLISLVLLWLYVIGNPYGQKVRVQGREKKVNPSQIDRLVKQDLERVLPEMEKTPEPTPPVPPLYADYDQLVQSSISDISSSVKIAMSGESEVVIEEDRLYALPQIPSLSNVGVGRLRGAAQIPTEEITPDQPYSSSPYEIGDIDLVSVSGRFDVRKLITNFQQSFMGPRLKTSWKDQALAAPVFARMDLQRRARQRDGSWGEWEVVSRTQVDPYQDLLEELPLSLEEAEYGVDLWVSQFKDDNVQSDILQPDSYEFTISRLDWLAPDFLQEATAILDKEEEQERREQLEERKDRRTPTRDTRRTTNERRPTRNRRPQPRGGRNEGRGDMMGMDTLQTPRRTTQKERTVDDVMDDFEQELLGEEFTITSIQDPILVWAHDDSMEPGKTYQYRIRIGVFNPIAGKDWFVSEQAEYKNQLVLWSEFSEPTEALEIPRRLYMFPMDVLKAQVPSEKSEGVRVEVAKYHLGQWRDFDFDVYPGQIIGYEVEDVDEDRPGQDEMMDEYQPTLTGMKTDETLVDFTSGNLFVDLNKEIIWGSRLRPTEIYTVLYSGGDSQIHQIPVGRRNWGPDIRKSYTMIQESMDRSVERRGSGPMPGDEMDMMDYEMMMMEMGG